MTPDASAGRHRRQFRMAATTPPRPFVGTGVVPSDRDRDAPLERIPVLAEVFGDPDDRLADSDPSRGLIGGGMARILGLCTALKLGNCPLLPTGTPATTTASAVVARLPARDFADLAHRATRPARTARRRIQPRRLISSPRLPAARPMSSPLTVARHRPARHQRARRQLRRDAFRASPATRLWPRRAKRDEHRAAASSHARTMPSKAACRADRGLRTTSMAFRLEVRDFVELTPFYAQVVNLFGSIFLVHGADHGRHRAVRRGQHDDHECDGTHHRDRHDPCHGGASPRHSPPIPDRGCGARRCRRDPRGNSGNRWS